MALLQSFKKEEEIYLMGELKWRAWSSEDSIFFVVAIFCINWPSRSCSITVASSASLRSNPSILRVENDENRKKKLFFSSPRRPVLAFNQMSFILKREMFHKTNGHSSLSIPSSRWLSYSFWPWPPWLKSPSSATTPKTTSTSKAEMPATLCKDLTGKSCH